jgi:hypothetical protein
MQIRFGLDSRIYGISYTAACLGRLRLSSGVIVLKLLHFMLYFASILDNNSEFICL